MDGLVASGTPIDTLEKSLTLGAVVEFMIENIYR